MRTMIVLVAVLAAGCGKDTGAADEVAREAAAEMKRKEAEGGVAKVQKAPVAEGVAIPCERLLAPEKFTEVLGEVAPLTVRDNTKANVQTNAACELIRGGEPLTMAQQAEKRKKEATLGVLPGDIVCYVHAVCSTIETAERFRKSCAKLGANNDESMGTFACMQVVPTGAKDPVVFHFFDDDTKCILKVGGGPSMTDNDLIRKCANTARDTIGPDQIKTDPLPPKTEAPSEGSAADVGSATK
jgi:hypothetical protein